MAEADFPKFTRKDRSQTEVEFEITVPGSVFNREYQKALKTFVSRAEIKGFRKGKAPNDRVEEKYRSEILEKAIEAVMPDSAAKVIGKEGVKPVAGVEYETSATPDPKKDFIFRAIVPILPEFKVPDLKKIIVKKESSDVTDEEVEQQLKYLWEKHKGRAKKMDDDWVKSISGPLGLKSQSLQQFREELKRGLESYKENVIRQKYASDLISEAIKLAGFEVPDQLVEAEVKERERTFQDYLKKIKVNESQFCQIRNITMDQMREQWRKDSLAALQDDIFLLQYARERDVQVTDDELDAEIQKVRKANPDASKDIFDNPRWKSYIKNVILKRKSYDRFLEETGYSKVFPVEKKIVMPDSEKSDTGDKKIII